jgi:hypothetical protein
MKVEDRRNKDDGWTTCGAVVHGGVVELKDGRFVLVVKLVRTRQYGFIYVCLESGLELDGVVMETPCRPLPGARLVIEKGEQ